MFENEQLNKMQDKAIEIFGSWITKGIRHKDYERVVDLAKQYKDIFTGIGIPKYMKIFAGREDKLMFKQRMDTYISTIPSTVNSILTPFNKALLSNRIYEYVSHKDNKKHQEIQDRKDNFYHGNVGNGVNEYLQNKYRYFATFDPNAFLCVEFSDFDARTEKARAFPLEYTSEEVYNFEYKNGKLNWVLVRKEHKYKKNEHNREIYVDGCRFLLYIGSYCYELKEVDNVLRELDNEQIEDVLTFNIGNNKVRTFAFKEYDLKVDEVPLRRFGYILDPVTENRTCLSILDSALPFFKKEIKTGSEFDLTMSMHVFPQKIIYGQICQGHKDKGCNNGIEVGGESICKGCGGSGITLPVHTSAQDLVVVKPPTRDGDPILDLEKAVVYKAPPIDIVKFQHEYQERLAERAKLAIFPSEAVVKASITNTATEAEMNLASVNDTLYPYGQKYSDLWKFIVKYIAIYSDNYEGVEIYHSFPKDLKLKSKDSLLEEAKLAKESGLNQNVINALNDDILEAQYADDPDTLTKLRIQNKFMPFSGKSETEIAVILSGDVIPYYKTLYTYFDAIFEDINETEPNFYIYPYAKQKQILANKVAEFQQMIPTNTNITSDEINALLDGLNNE